MQEEELSTYAPEELPPEEKPAVIRVLKGIDNEELPKSLVLDEDSADVPHMNSPSDRNNKESKIEKKQQDIRSLISKMNLPQKVKLAMFGNSIVRGLLIRDMNKLIQNCVLKNPKLQQGEIEDFAKNTNVAENVLRSIGGSSTWMKSYKCKLNLVMNPKTPIDLSLRWIKFITPDHLKLISLSKSIPQVIQVMAKKRLTDSKKH